MRARFLADRPVGAPLPPRPGPRLLPIGQPVARGHGPAPEQERAPVDQRLQLGPAPAGEEGDGPVDPLAGQRGRHRETFAHSFQPRATISTTPTEMAMSA